MFVLFMFSMFLKHVFWFYVFIMKMLVNVAGFSNIFRFSRHFLEIPKTFQTCSEFVQKLWYFLCFQDISEHFRTFQKCCRVFFWHFQNFAEILQKFSECFRIFLNFSEIFRVQRGQRGGETNRQSDYRTIDKQTDISDCRFFRFFGSGWRI